MKICSNCHHPIPEDQDTCPNCGAGNYKKIDSHDTMFCPNCGFKISYTSKFCSNCGNKIDLSHESTKQEASNTSTTPVKNNDKNIAIIIAVIFIAIAISGFGLNSFNQKVIPSSSKPVSSVKQTPPPDIKKVPLPAKFRSVSVDKNLIGEPTLSVVLENNTDKTIDAFKVCASAKNNYNETIKEYGYGSQFFFGISQKEIKPHQKSTGSGYWTMNGFDSGTKFKVQLWSVHFTDGSEWKSEQSEQEIKEVKKSNIVIE